MNCGGGYGGLGVPLTNCGGGILWCGGGMPLGIMPLGYIPGGGIPWWEFGGPLAPS